MNYYVQMHITVMILIKLPQDVTIRDIRQDIHLVLGVADLGSFNCSVAPEILSPVVFIINDMWGVEFGILLNLASG